MRTGRKYFLVVAVIASLAAAFIFGRYCLTAGSAVAAEDGAEVRVVSDQFNVVQVLDRQNGVVCYSRSTPAGTSISCVKSQ